MLRINPGIRNNNENLRQLTHNSLRCRELGQNSSAVTLLLRGATTTTIIAIVLSAATKFRLPESQKILPTHNLI